MQSGTKIAMSVLVLGTLLRVTLLQAAEAPAAKQVRCNTYANRAVEQYNQAIAHPQCSLNVDTMWQPNHEFHYQACMHLGRDVIDGQTASRDNVLQGCSTSTASTSTGGTSAASPAPAAQTPIALPPQLKECERSLLKFCGSWILNGQQYVATWENGAKATLTVTRFDGHSIALHRIDAGDSSAAGMTGDYLGQIEGGNISGKATYAWPGHFPVGYGTWTATFTPAVAAAPTAPAPPATPAQTK